MNKLSKLVSAMSVVKSSYDTIFLKNLSLDSSGEVKNKPYTKSSLVYSCISTTAKAIAQVPLVVMARSGKGWEQVWEDDPIQQLISEPNPLLPTTFEFVNALISHLLLSGHVWTFPFPPGAKVPTFLYVIKKNSMEKIVDKDSGHLLGWMYTPKQGTSIPIMANEVSSMKFFNPDDDIMGLAPIDAGELPLLSDYKAAKYNERFFDEGAMPSIALTTERSISEKQEKRILNWWDDRHKGYLRSHRPALLEGGLKMDKVGLSQNDMQFLELRRFNREELLQVYGMKKSVISVSEDINYATAENEKKEWWQSTNVPLMMILQSALTHCVYKSKGIINRRIVFDISGVPALQEDFHKKVETAERLWRIGFSGNEINEKLQLGFDSKSWRDSWYVVSNMAQIGESGVTLLSGPTPPPIASLPSSTYGSGFRDQVSATNNGDYDFFSSTAQAELALRWKNLIAEVDNVEWSMEGKIRRLFFDMRKRILKLLNQKSASDLSSEEFLQEKKDLIRYTVGIFEQAATLGAESLAAEIEMGTTFSTNDPRVIEFLTSKPIKITRVIDTVREQIRQELSEGLKRSETIIQMAERMKRVMTNASGRAMTIARTEVGGTVNFARSFEISNSPFKRKIWFTALDEAVRPTHVVMHGKKTEINKPWIVGGSSLRFPGDPMGPAKEIINCRCIEIVDPSSRS